MANCCGVHPGAVLLVVDAAAVVDVAGAGAGAGAGADAGAGAGAGADADADADAVAAAPPAFGTSQDTSLVTVFQ